MSGYDDAPLPPEPPSFEPWLTRVSLIRAWVTASVFLMVGAISYTNGLELADSALRAIVVAVISYFVAWGGALWMCSELYYAQIRRMRDRLNEIERTRVQRLEQLYRDRLRPAGSAQDTSFQTTPIDQAQRPAA